MGELLIALIGEHPELSITINAYDQADVVLVEPQHVKSVEKIKSKHSIIVPYLENLGGSWTEKLAILNPAHKRQMLEVLRAAASKVDEHRDGIALTTSPQSHAVAKPIVSRAPERAFSKSKNIPIVHTQYDDILVKLSRDKEVNLLWEISYDQYLLVHSKAHTVYYSSAIADNVKSLHKLFKKNDLSARHLELTDEDANLLIQRTTLKRGALDDFLWSLSFNATPHLKGYDALCSDQLMVKLKRWPNFSELEYHDKFIQWTALFSRKPQKVKDVLASCQSNQEIVLFLTFYNCCVLCNYFSLVSEVAAQVQLSQSNAALNSANEDKKSKIAGWFGKILSGLT